MTTTRVGGVDAVGVTLPNEGYLQAFQVSSPTSIGAVSVGHHLSTPGAPLVIEIVDDNFTTILATTAQFSGQENAAGAEDMSIIPLIAPLSLTPGTPYWIGIRTTAAPANLIVEFGTQADGITIPGGTNTEMAPPPLNPNLATWHYAPITAPDNDFSSSVGIDSHIDASHHDTGNYTHHLRFAIYAQAGPLSVQALPKGPDAAGEGPFLVSVVAEGPYGTGAPLYTFDFGDGTPVVGPQASPDAPPHVYVAPGTYLVTCDAYVPPALGPVRNLAGFSWNEIIPNVLIDGAPQRVTTFNFTWNPPASGPVNHYYVKAENATYGVLMDMTDTAGDLYASGSGDTAMYFSQVTNGADFRTPLVVTVEAVDDDGTRSAPAQITIDPNAPITQTATVVVEPDPAASQGMRVTFPSMPAGYNLAVVTLNFAPPLAFATYTRGDRTGTPLNANHVNSGVVTSYVEPVSSATAVSSATFYGLNLDDFDVAHYGGGTLDSGQLITATRVLS